MHILFILKETQDEHLGVMYLSGMLKKNGHHVDVAKADYDCIQEKLKKNTQTLLAYSTLAYYADYYLELNRRIKENFKVFSIFGGTFPTASPEMIEREGVDAVCMGEGELSLLELANSLERGQEIRNIQNLWIKQNGQIYRNPLRPLVENLDVLPFPDRNLFLKKSPFFCERVSMITSRGCAFSCPYCYNSTLDRLYGQDIRVKYRRRGVDNVIEEIQQIKKSQPVKFVLFHDDIFTLWPLWLEEFSYKWSQVHLPFCCYIRIDLIDSHIAGLLKEAGCHSVSFGIESGDDFTRNRLLKRGMSRQKIMEGARLLKKHGIRLRSTNIIGATNHSMEADLETLKVNIQCQVDLANVGMLDFYPNTDICNETGTLHGGWAKCEDFQPPVLIKAFRHLSRDIACNFQRIDSTFSSPKVSLDTKRQERKVSNLYSIFSIIASFPFLFSIVRLLVKLPAKKVFMVLNFLWINYCSYFRIYPIGLVGIFRGFIRHRKALKNI